jgi:ABC-type sugar transport system ATPase subunit
MATSERTPVLLLDDVVKTYGAVRAVDGISLKAFAGEFIALLELHRPPDRRDRR